MKVRRYPLRWSAIQRGERPQPLISRLSRFLLRQRLHCRSSFSAVLSSAPPQPQSGPNTMTGKPHGAELPVSLAKRITAGLVETENEGAEASAPFGPLAR